MNEQNNTCCVWLQNKKLFLLDFKAYFDQFLFYTTRTSDKQFKLKKKWKLDAGNGIAKENN